MKFIASTLALFVALVTAAPTLEDKPLEARVPAPQLAKVYGRQGCTVGSSPDQGVVKTMYQTAKGRGIGDYDDMMKTLFATAYVESYYHNLGCGDQDSVGVYQQRPSMGIWGTRSQCMDVVHATNAFLDAAENCAQWHPEMGPGDVAQCAQGSERPQAYNDAMSSAEGVLAAAINAYGGGGSSYAGGAANVESGPSTSAKTSSSSSGASSGTCAHSHKAVKGDTCKKIAKKFGISTSTLHSLNSSINKSCSNLKVGKSYCVKKGTSMTTSKTASSGSSGSSSGCGKHREAKQGDTCAKLAKDGGISTSKFHSLNPGVNSKCTNLVAGKSYCIKA